MLKKICVLTVSSLLFAASLLAQSRPSATNGRVSLFAGAEMSTFNPDWGCVSASGFSCWDRHLLGVGALVDANHVFLRFGVEGEARWLHWGGPGGGLVQSNYLVGPRYPVLQKKLSAYAKCPVGVSRMTFPHGIGNGSYFSLAPGGTAEFAITRKVVVRADYEYQIWPLFSGVGGLPHRGLTPNGLSFGFTYRL